MLSLIICTYNRDKYIYSCLKSIAENNYDPENYEVLLINNNSTDKTEAECRRFQQDYPDIPYKYFMETNQGLSHARNRGIKEANGDILVFLDDDAFVGKEYLKNLQENIEKHPDWAAFGGKITPVFENGKPPKWLSKWTYSWVSAIDMGKDVRLFEGEKYPTGANMGILKKTLEKVGNFNVKLGRSKKNLMGGEEKDIFNRIKNIGGKIYWFPNIKVQHVIPENRTTDSYIIRLGLGVGMSERLRTLAISRVKYLNRIFFEALKWSASMVLFAFYLLKLQPQKGSKLLLFRWNVTKGLLLGEQL
ncbi:MAG: glycosyltransferase [Prevotellaceae bacterium]|jgi:glycosyltransferase involved in cell wall biosynthesis|nr:glycosyltransferase [Prevotellaceae bacterium]